MIRANGAAAIGLVALAACKFPELEPLDEIDATSDGSGGGGDAIDATTCEGDRYGFTISNIAPCDIPTATASLDLSNVVRIDTFAGTMLSGGGSTAPLPGTALVAQGSGPQIRVVSVTSLIVPGTVTIDVRGENPIAFLVRGDATVSGTLSLTSTTVGGLQVAGARMNCGTGNGSVGTGAPPGWRRWWRCARWFGWFGWIRCRNNHHSRQRRCGAR